MNRNIVVTKYVNPFAPNDSFSMFSGGRKKGALGTNGLRRITTLWKNRLPNHVVLAMLCYPITASVNSVNKIIILKSRIPFQTIFLNILRNEKYCNNY